MSLTSVSSNIVLFSGGSAANSLTDVFNHLIESKHCGISYVIPISDNGGSTSELIRVFGGPGIGDVRSRLVRLIPHSTSNPSRRAIRDFFNYRLALDPTTARTEWLDIVEARHTLWNDISSAKKELIRSFLNLVNLEIVKRARPTSVFNFGGASVGNLFLTGARLFSGSFESAVYLLASLCSIPSTICVLPAINTNFSHHICAGLADGTTIPGQNAISHPSEATDPVGDPVADKAHRQRPSHSSIGHASDVQGEEHRIGYGRRDSLDHADTIEDANWPGSLPVLRRPYISFSKAPPAPSSQRNALQTEGTASSAPNGRILPDPTSMSDTVERGTPSTITAHHSTVLPSPIQRLWYINPYGQEIRPYPNASVISHLQQATSVIYSIGSLYTSLVPSLILRGVGDAIASVTGRPRILILNGSTDRETSSAFGAFTGLDFVEAIVRACEESRGVFTTLATNDTSAARQAWKTEACRYITHIIYIDERGAPAVDTQEMRELGIECMKVWGRRGEDGDGWRYDLKGLGQALEALVSRGAVPKSRRNTLVG